MKITILCYSDKWFGIHLINNFVETERKSLFSRFPLSRVVEKTVGILILYFMQDSSTMNPRLII